MKYEITSKDPRWKRVVEVFQKESERLSILFGKNLNYVNLIITDMGVKTIGQAGYNKRFPLLSEIKINTNYLRDWENFNHVVTHTISHELVHLFAIHLYGEKGSGHGKIWKSMMVEAGLNPERCFNNAVDVSKYSKRKYKRYYVQCPRCEIEHGLTPKVYSRLGIYSCNLCKSPLANAKLIRTENV